MNITDEYCKYLIFLPNRFNRREQMDVGCICAKLRRCIMRELNDKGITVRFRSNIRDYTTNETTTYKFNDDFFPKMNVLYVHLIGGEYYTDDIYTKKKTEKERDILFLLAAKLGVKTINYKITKVIHTMKKMNVNAKIKKSKTQFKYSKSSKEIKGEEGKESYINRGAPIYNLSRDLRQVEDNIKERFSTFDPNSFSYDFYENNSNLRTFVYKRYKFKMCSVEYTCDLEFDLDISFGVRETLLDYGIGVDYNEHNITCEKVTYKLDFYKDKELRLKFNEILIFEQDPFSVVREVYEDDNYKDTAIYHITEYVRKFAKSCSLTYVKKREPNKTLKDTYHERLNHWIKEHSVENFEKECHKFTSSFQIRTWFKEALIYGDEEVEELDDEYEGAGNYGILKLKRYKNKESKNVLLKTENYAIASNSCKTALQYPLQYYCSIDKDIDADKDKDKDKAISPLKLQDIPVKGVDKRPLGLKFLNSPVNNPIKIDKQSPLLKSKKMKVDSNIVYSPSPNLSPHFQMKKRRSTTDSENSIDNKYKSRKKRR